jgi:hypothetical protein
LLVVSLSLAGVFFSGCTGDGPAVVESGPILLMDEDDCARWSPYCRVAEDGGLHISGLRVMGSRSEMREGIVISAPGRDIHLRDVQVDDVDFGIIILHAGCAECRLSLEEVKVSAKTLGIGFASIHGRVELRAVDIRTDGGGIVSATEVPGGVISMAIDASQGLLFAEENHGSVALTDVSIAAAEPSASPGLRESLESRLGAWELRGVSIKNHRYAAYGLFVGLVSDRLTIDCIESGVDSLVPLDGAPPVESVQVTMTRTSIRGCTDTGLRLLGAKVVQLTDFEVLNGSRALELPAIEHLEITNFSIVGTDYGLEMPDGPSQREATLVNGYVAYNRFAGIHAKFHSVLVDNVTFVKNGHGWPDPEFPGPVANTRARYGGLVVTPPFQLLAEPSADSLIVLNSQFVDNEPFGLASEGLEVVQAAGNWWGAADGPNVVLQGTILALDPISLGPGGGDNVTQNVLFLPYRTGP